MTWTRREMLHALALAPALAGCRPGTATRSPGATPFEHLPYAPTSTSRRAKVFLVAGGADIANFAQEVVDQAQVWRRLGVRPEEIACYYAKPSKKSFAADKAQYRRLLPSLAACRRADPGLLRRDLLEAAEAAPSFVYLYLTAHGVHSFLRTQDASARANVDLSPRERKALDQPIVALDAGVAAPGPELEAVVSAMRRGVALHELLLTPTHLADVLSAFPDETLKIVVIQACFSGAFIGHSLGLAKPQPRDLTHVPNMIAMTSTVAERPSFGCGPGEERTFFGDAFTTALSAHAGAGDAPQNLHWSAFFDHTEAVVRRLERDEQETPSLPGFFSNVEHAAKR